MQQRMGFSDPDLTSAKHDEIIVWLVENCERVARSIGFKSESTTSIECGLPALAEAGAMERFEQEKSSKVPKFNIRLEHAVMDKTFVVGFVDAVIEVSVPQFNIRMSRDSVGNRIATCRWGEQVVDKFYIEVKPSIPSFGEFLRQIRHYQAYLGDVRLFACSPDVRFKPHIEQQGIGFIVAPS